MSDGVVVRPPRRSLLSFASFLALLSASIGASLIPDPLTPRIASAQSELVAVGCPDEGRNPNTIVSPPVVSPQVQVCTQSRTVSAAGISGTTVSADRCPEWMITGLRYNPAMPKPGYRITRDQDVYSKLQKYSCRYQSFFWGLYSSTSCAMIHEEIIETQVHVLRDGPCPLETVDPS